MKSLPYEHLKIIAGNEIDLKTINTHEDGGLSRSELKKIRGGLWQQLHEWQERLYSESEQSLLVVFQAMDAAGKDSSIEKLTMSMNAHGCRVVSFKKPTPKEMSHDFLWRIHREVPPQGEICIFNRSHYEDVLIVKVHDWEPAARIERRYEYINRFEELLSERGTRILKFMLHISPEYQLSRFKSRLQEPGKNWKFNPGDLEERKHWDNYMSAFSTAMSKCSSDTAPWYVIPAENRRYRDCVVASIVLDTLKDMNPQYPQPDYDVNAYRAEDLI